MKDLIRTTLLIVAIYSGAIAAREDGHIHGALICGVSCSVLVMIKYNKKKD